MDILQRVKKWSEKVGVNVAYLQLIREGLSPSMAWKVVYGEYKHKPKQLAKDAMERAIKK